MFLKHLDSRLRGYDEQGIDQGFIRVPSVFFRGRSQAGVVMVSG